MDPDESLLELLSGKERELKERSDRISRESQEILSQAQKMASHILDTAEREGKVEADIRYREIIQEVRRDIRTMSDEGIRRAEEIRVAGEENLSRTVRLIISLVKGLK